ncbi:MAG: PIN domain-containing protein [Solirubrobacteraceae bacterium]
MFVELERSTRSAPASPVIDAFSDRLTSILGEDEDVGIAAITASELLHGVHRANAERRTRREAFVEAVLATFPILPFDLLVARVHARLWATLAAAGADVGAHDRIVAATAMAAGWRVATGNMRHFEPIAGLDAVQV